MSLQQILSISQVVIGILLGTAILLQQKGTGLSGTFGGEGGFYRTKRGFEKILFGFTIALACLFLITGISRIAFTENTAATLSDIPPVAPPLQIQTEPVTPVEIPNAVE